MDERTIGLAVKEHNFSSDALVRKLFVTVTSLTFAGAVSGLSVFAAGGGSSLSESDDLTALFDTYAFSGSMSTISKMPWLSALLSGIISVFCFVGLFLTCFRIIDTMLYLSGRNLFDRVHEIKSVGTSSGGKFFGMGAMSSDIFHGKQGSGLDAFVGFFLMLLPDVKEYSDMAEGKRFGNLDDDETVTTYILKISLQTILTVFFFSIGFNGVLWQAYGNVVDAMGVAAETAVNVNLDQYVDRALNTGSNYRFAYADDNSNLGDLRQEIAKKMYAKLLQNTTDLTTDSKLAIGSAVDTYVSTKIDASAIDRAISTVDVATNDSDAKNLSFDITANTIAKLSSTASNVLTLNVPFEDLGVTGSADYYMHISIFKKGNAIDFSHYNKFKTSSTKNSSSGSGEIVDPTEDATKN